MSLSPTNCHRTNSGCAAWPIRCDLTSRERGGPGGLRDLLPHGRNRQRPDPPGHQVRLSHKVREPGLHGSASQIGNASRKSVRRGPPGIIGKSEESSEEGSTWRDEGPGGGQIDRLWDPGTFVGLTDAQLLPGGSPPGRGRCRAGLRGPRERHGSMVFRVCWAVLRDEHAAEDALPRAGQEGMVASKWATACKLAARRRASRRGPKCVRRRPSPPARASTAEASPACETMPDHPRSEAWATRIARLPERTRPVVPAT